MEISINIKLPDNISRQDAARALFNVGERCGGQIEMGILDFPLELDLTIQMGSDVDDVEVEMFRTE